MGDASHSHHLHLRGIEKVEGHRDVEAHAYSSGRYKVRIEPHDGLDHSHDEHTEDSFALTSQAEVKKTQEAVTDTKAENSTDSTADIDEIEEFCEEDIDGDGIPDCIEF